MRPMKMMKKNMKKMRRSEMSSDYREKLRAMAQEERERMNDFILSEARRKEQKDLEPEPVPDSTSAPVVVEPDPVVVRPVETPEPAPEPEPEPKPVPPQAENKENKKKSFNFLAEGDVREWLLYKRECGYNTSSLIKRVLREYMAHDMEWLAHIRKQVP